LRKEEDLSMSGLEVETSEENCPRCGERQVAVYWSLDTGDNVMWKCQACGVKGFFTGGTILTVEESSSSLMV
jgi:DNA-directed RNA polymerase subunit M/transcription elongation factor TFIIS